MKKRTLVTYSYFDNKTGARLTSAEGVEIEGEVTPKKVRAVVLSKWKKIGYNADANSIEIENEDSLVSL
jgi:hypothetical protein